MGWGNVNSLLKKIDSRLAKTQQICIFLPGGLQTPWGQWLCLAPQLHPSLKILRMWLIISLLHFFFQLRSSLRWSVSSPLNKFLRFVSDISLKWRKVFIHEYLLCAEWEKLRGPRMVLSLRDRAMGAEAAGITTGRQNSIQVSTILEVFCMLFRESEWVSLQMWREAEMETITWKHFIWSGAGGGTVWKNPNFFKEQREVDERIWGYNDQSLYCLPSLPTLFPKCRRKWGQRN